VEEGNTENNKKQKKETMSNDHQQQQQNDHRFTAVVFGATGFTGQYVLRDLLRYVAETSANTKKSQITVAAAGRNEAAVRSVSIKNSCIDYVSMLSVFVVGCSILA